MVLQIAIRHRILTTEAVKMKIIILKMLFKMELAKKEAEAQL
jgi:hypothetical protein